MENKRFDVVGLNWFWQIVGLLEGGHEPTAELWDNLFHSPAYATLTTHPPLERDFLTAKFREAFKPRPLMGADTLERSKHDPYLAHYLRVRGLRDSIMQDAKYLESQALEVFDTALEAVRRWLPATYHFATEPQVCFAVFAYDSRCTRPIVIDILFAIELRTALPLLMGHEFFHHAAAELLVYDPQTIPTAAAPMVAAMRQVQEEGIADYIYKIADSEYMTLVNTSRYVIERLDSLLGQWSNGPTAEIGHEFHAAIPRNGHPTGYYMTSVILERIGKTPLIDEVGNPFGFFRLYQHAAEGSDLPTFSPAALAVIEQLEREYRFAMPQ